MSTLEERHLDRLLNELVDGTLTEAEERQLADMLRADPAVRQEYRRWMALHADLYWDYASAMVGRSESGDWSRQEPAFGRGSRRFAWTAAALLLVVVTSVLLRTWIDPSGSVADQPVIGRIVPVAGTVQVDNGGDMRLLAAPAELRAGASVRVVGLAGLAMLRLDDGTEISLAGETRLQCNQHAGRTTIALYEGNLSANVVSRAADRPLQIHTSNAQISVLGTRLAVSAGAETSQLGVRQGRVQLRRLTDGETIDVGSGQYAVVSQRAALEARPWPTTPETWCEDFEDGLPDQWRYGQWLRNGPAGDSRGVVLATRRFAMDGSDSQLHRITLPKRWMEGLWRLEEDTVLHFTYKMSRPGWFHIMMGVRSDDLNASHVGNYELQSSFWKKGEPDHWQTVSVPLAAFRRNVRGVPYADLPPVSPRAGDVAYLLWFNTGDVDRGLMIDRIWVDRNRQSPEDEP